MRFDEKVSRTIQGRRVAIVLVHGDSRAVLPEMTENSVDSCVTDPPYSLVSIQKRFGKSGSAPTVNEGVYRRASAGFMGHQWDTGENSFSPEFWKIVWRILKPGAYVAAFSGTRTYHRMACAIEDAGFAIYDQIGWVYGSGFPKSHKIGDGLGTALKPAWEPICLARKAVVGTIAENVRQFGTGALNIDGCRIKPVGDGDYVYAPGEHGYEGRTRVSGFGISAGVRNDGGRWPTNLCHDGSEEVLACFPIKNGKSVARFFYSGKARDEDRLGSKHPTIKPIDLMRWLVRLVTPKGGLVLDPFAGTGTTAVAAAWEGMDSIMVEREAGYFADMQNRISEFKNDNAFFSPTVEILEMGAD